MTTQKFYPVAGGNIESVVLATLDSNGIPQPVTQSSSSVEGIIGSDGVVLPIDSLAMTISTYPPSGTGTQNFTVVYGGNTYIQTLTFATDELTNVSQWVKQ